MSTNIIWFIYMLCVMWMWWKVLAGHEGPLACLDFSPTGGTLASSSWDGTLKIWDIYKNECMDTLEHGCDVLCIAFRPDGKFYLIFIFVCWILDIFMNE